MAKIKPIKPSKRLLNKNEINKRLEGLMGLIFAIFKWYGEEDQEMAEYPKHRTVMRFHNVVTLGIYFALLLVILSSLLPMFLTS